MRVHFTLCWLTVQVDSLVIDITRQSLESILQSFILVLSSSSLIRLRDFARTLGHSLVDNLISTQT